MALSQDPMTFWRHLRAAHDAHMAGDDGKAREALLAACPQVASGSKELREKRMALLENAARVYKLEIDWPSFTSKARPPLPHESTSGSDTASSSTGKAPEKDKQIRLGPITAEGEPGISLVTCAMNRSENLIRALASWLPHAAITEIVIVDWSSDIPVRESLLAAGITDRRIRVIRVESEPRWILSYAFNIGFRVARCIQVLKVDADIVLGADFFAQNQLTPQHFIAGNWRNAEKGQEHVNGFFFAHKEDLAKVGGFNEFIKTYGWDDDDLYQRLVNIGIIRQDVAASTIHHLDHSDEERTGLDTGDEKPRSAREEITSSTIYLIRRNHFLSNVMPVWTRNETLLPVSGTVDDAGNMTLRRTGWEPAYVPETIEKDADHYAALELLSWRLGRRVLHLSREQLALLLERPLSRLGPLDVEVSLRSPTPHEPPPAGYLVVTLPKAALENHGQTVRILSQIDRTAASHGMEVVLSGGFSDLPEAIAKAGRGLVYVPEWERLGTLEPISPAQLKLGPDPLPADGDAAHYRLDLDDSLFTDAGADIFHTTGTQSPPLRRPRIMVSKPRFYIDAQHGLGNRMRAIGSAAAIAEKTDRELVIVWDPDHHCEGRFDDLFDYDGAVIEASFVKDAASEGCAVFNYMEIEEGAEKDAPISAPDSQDIYARSAYVLNSPHSDWESENRFLRSLTPIEAVRDLVASVRSPNDLSAHVRMEAGKGLDHNTYDDASNWTEEGHRLIHEWRAKSHFSHFMKRIDALIDEGRAERIFLAADLPETYDRFVEVYGSRVTYLPRPVYDRSSEQLIYALADALLLGRAELLLGSTWSSFSELAMRLSPQNLKVEMSGKDF